MALGRVVNMSVGSSTNTKGLLISDLDIDFNINRSIEPTDNTAEFTIYNAKEETRKEILKEGNTVNFEVGHADEIVGSIFVGNIMKSISYKTGTDWVTEILAVTKNSNKTLARKNISVGYAPGSAVSKPLKEIANILGLAVFGLENATTIMNNGFYFVGSSKQALRKLGGILYKDGAYLYADNNELIAYKRTATSRFKVVYLTYSGGLKNIHDITEEPKDNGSSRKVGAPPPKKKVGFQSIIIPQLQPNGPVAFKTPSISSTFIVDKLNFFGNNYGGDFDVKGEASAW